jgi:hypothetical protein
MHLRRRNVAGALTCAWMVEVSGMGDDIRETTKG